MPEQNVCAYCKNPEILLTEENSLEIFDRDLEGWKIIHAVVHRACARRMGENAFPYSRRRPTTVTGS